jgi:hypothetical protein
MDRNGPFGIDPDEFDRVVRETGETLRGAFERAGFGLLFDQFAKQTARPGPRQRPQPETAGEAGDGVWAIYTSDAHGKAQVEQVYRTELDALRANRHNTDPDRGVRFLPYGIDVSVLDAHPEADRAADPGADPGAGTGAGTAEAGGV